MDFEIIGPIEQATTIAAGAGVRQTRRLRRLYGGRRWLKRKGFARIRTSDGMIKHAEIHWYEAHGIGKREFKISRSTETS